MPVPLNNVTVKGKMAKKPIPNEQERKNGRKFLYPPHIIDKKKETAISPSGLSLRVGW